MYEQKTAKKNFKFSLPIGFLVDSGSCVAISLLCHVHCRIKNNKCILMLLLTRNPHCGRTEIKIRNGKRKEPCSTGLKLPILVVFESVFPCSIK